MDLTQPAGRILYAANAHGGDVTMVDVPSGRIVGTFPVGGVLDDMHLRGGALYFTRKQVNDLAALDSSTGEPLWTVPMPGTPHHMSLSPDGTRAFVPIFDGEVICIVDTGEAALIGQVTVGKGSHATRLTRDGSVLYVGTCLDNTLVAVDTSSHEVLRTLPFRDAVRPFALNADETTMYVQLSNLHGIVIVDPVTGEQLDEILLPALPDGTEPALWDTVDHGLEFTPDYSQVWAVATTGRYVAAYSVPDHELLGVVPLGSEPNWVIFDAAGEYGYISNRADDTVSIVSVAELREVVRVKVGEYPQRMLVRENRSP
jgi:DNA-binding beta-propeller fold protein YncE